MARGCEHSREECRSCFKERIGSIQVGASATASRFISRDRSRGGRPKDKEPDNRWEKGRPTDHRGMPYLDSEGARIGVKQLAETRNDYRKHQSIEVD